MQITKRLVTTKRHTAGYLVGGRWVTRAQAVRLAERGKIPGVTVRRSRDATYIASLPYTRRLYDLPKVEAKNIRSRTFRIACTG